MKRLLVGFFLFVVVLLATGPAQAQRGYGRRGYGRPGYYRAPVARPYYGPRYYHAAPYRPYGGRSYYRPRPGYYPGYRRRPGTSVRIRL